MGDPPDDYPKVSRRGPPMVHSSSFMGAGMPSLLEEGSVLSQIASQASEPNSTIARQLLQSTMELRQQQVNIAQMQLLLEKRQIEQAEREKETQQLYNQVMHRLQMYENQMATMGAGSQPQPPHQPLHLVRQQGDPTSSGYQTMGPSSGNSMNPPPRQTSYEQQPHQTMTLPPFNSNPQEQNNASLTLNLSSLIPAPSSNQGNVVWGGRPDTLCSEREPTRHIQMHEHLKGGHEEQDAMRDNSSTATCWQGLYFQ